MRVIFAFGGNLPFEKRTPFQTIQFAMRELSRELGSIAVASAAYETPCFPAGAGPDFVNACAMIETDAPVETIFSTIHEIESQSGRKRDARWSARTLDIDVIAIDDLVLPDRKTVAHWVNLAASDQARAAPNQPIIPHPRIQDRAFVLIPLCDVAPDWVHPVLNTTARNMLNALPGREISAVTRLEAPILQD